MSTQLSQMNGMHKVALPPVTITTAVTGVTTTPITNLVGVNSLLAEAKFTYGSGGTNATAYVQTSLDRGTTWIDIMSFQFTTASGNKISKVSTGIALAAATVPGDAALTANTIVDGLIGDRFRLKYTTTGTYGGSTTLQIDLIFRG